MSAGIQVKVFYSIGRIFVKLITYRILIAIARSKYIEISQLLLLPTFTGNTITLLRRKWTIRGM